jgi:hypothetical protein
MPLYIYIYNCRTLGRLDLVFFESSFDGKGLENEEEEEEEERSREE